MNQHKTQGLRHVRDCKSRLQRSESPRLRTWGFAPGWYHPRLQRSFVSALTCLTLSLAGCKLPTPPPIDHPASAAYPPRPSVPPPPFKVFHQDNDTYTLVTKENATDDEIAALLWQFRDANHAHTFDALHLSQKFIDARAPKVWFHVYRGAKCANEKFTKGDYPCGAAYHGAGDYTLGGFKDPRYEEGVLVHADGTETKLWDSEKH